MAAAADETGPFKQRTQLQREKPRRMGTWQTELQRVGTANGAREWKPGKRNLRERRRRRRHPGNEETGTWKQEDGGWRYYGEDGTYKKNSWEQIGGYWYHFGKDGLMAAGWQKIGGYYYCFRETGDLAIGWCYNDEEEKWYYFDKDGTAKKAGFRMKTEAGTGSPREERWPLPVIRSIDGKRYYFFSRWPDGGQSVRRAVLYG